MRFTSTAVVRNDLLQQIADQTVLPFIYPNSLIIDGTFTYFGGPFGKLARYTYTVPANRKAIISAGELFIRRVTAATTTGSTSLEYDYTPNGGAEVIIQRAGNQLGSVNHKVESRLTYNMLMSAGDVIKGYSQDTSTGGQTYCFGNISILEFDA